MAVTKDDIIEFLKGATILEVSELVKAIEDEFGVTAAAPVAVAAVAAGGDAGGADAAPSEVTVTLKEAGGQKLQVIKAIRTITGLGLKEAKELVDGAPSEVKAGIDPDEGAAIKAQLEEAGATVEVK
jgi:large subunit ribosomal protein L7/L12